MHGRPILGYESLKELFMLLKVNNNMFKCWLDISGWGIIEAMHNVVFKKTRFVIIEINFLSISVDEVNTINNQ
jgi:hypothetical protein